MAPSMQSALAVGVLVGQALAVNNGLARTPQMGWVCQELALTILCSEWGLT